MHDGRLWRKALTDSVFAAQTTREHVISVHSVHRQRRPGCKSARQSFKGPRRSVWRQDMSRRRLLRRSGSAPVSYNLTCLCRFLACSFGTLRRSTRVLLKGCEELPRARGEGAAHRIAMSFSRFICLTFHWHGIGCRRRSTWENSQPWLSSQKRGLHLRMPSIRSSRCCARLLEMHARLLKCMRTSALGTRGAVSSRRCGICV